MDDNDIQKRRDARPRARVHVDMLGHRIHQVARHPDSRTVELLRAAGLDGEGPNPESEED